MKLILSSSDFLNDKSKRVIIDNIDKNILDCKVLFIPNEKATQESINSNKYYNRLYKNGFLNKNNIFIYNENETDKFKNLKIDLIYVSGGNTFATLFKIRKNNFDKEIIKYIKNGVIYIGGSCGAHIVSKNIKHVLNFEDNYININNYDALTLFDGVIIPHYNDIEYNKEKRKKVYKKMMLQNKYNIYTLTNEESLIINDNEIFKI